MLCCAVLCCVVLVPLSGPHPRRAVHLLSPSKKQLFRASSEKIRQLYGSPPGKSSESPHSSMTDLADVLSKAYTALGQRPPPGVGSSYLDVSGLGSGCVDTLSGVQEGVGPVCR